LHADWVESHTSGTQAFIRQYQDAGHSVADRHCTHAELEVSQTIPREVHPLVEVQAVLQTLRMQRWLLPLQLLSTKHSMHTLFAESQILVEQSPLFLQVARATHLLLLHDHDCPVAQSELVMH
jgi:hypothetical protein